MSPADPGVACFLAEIRGAAGRARAAARARRRDRARSPRSPRERGSRLVRMVGHGSSDNAASYGVYAFGLLPRWTAMRDSITLTVHYDTPLDLSGLDGDRALAVRPDARRRRVRRPGAPQRRVHGRDHERPGLRSGHRRRGDDPARRGRRAGGRGDEDLREHARGARPARRRTSPAAGAELADGLRRAAELLDEARSPVRARDPARSPLPFSYTGRMFVIGRGTEFATAREIALKLLETCRVAAEPLTATDLAHGPVAALDPFFPVWAIASPDGDAPDRAGGRARASTRWARRSSRAAPRRTRSRAASTRCRSRRREPALLSPLLSVVPGQLFALCARARPGPRPGCAARAEQGDARRLRAAAGRRTSGRDWLVPHRLEQLVVEEPVRRDARATVGPRRRPRGR